ncbi:MAG: chromate transporter [Oscillospiraceae bacterium]|nr:chromate transporter [Oscillospiraceae bacterium]
MILLRLFYEFFITGLFAFGGGLATIPFLREMATRTGWFTLEQLMDMIAISESTPGPIGINMATFAGFTTAGVLGGVIASLGLIVPSVIIATIVSRLLDRFRENSMVKSAFYGLRAASIGLIAAAGLSVLGMAMLNTELFSQTGAFLDLFNFKAMILAILLFVATNKLKAHPIIFLAGSAVVGIIFF